MQLVYPLRLHCFPYRWCDEIDRCVSRDQNYLTHILLGLCIRIWVSMKFIGIIPVRCHDIIKKSDRYIIHVFKKNLYKNNTCVISSNHNKSWYKFRNILIMANSEFNSVSYGRNFIYIFLSLSRYMIIVFVKIKHTYNKNIVKNISGYLL